MALLNLNWAEEKILDIKTWSEEQYITIHMLTVEQS